MGDVLESVRRCIAREESLRGSGTEPYPPTIQQTIATIAANPELLADPELRKYVAARSITSNYFTASKVYDLILPLHNQGFVDEAINCFRALAHIDEPMIWDPMGNNFYNLLATKAFKEILNEEFLVAYSQTWGLLAVDIFSSLLGAVWASDWDSTIAKAGDFERHRPSWFGDPSQSTLNARWLVGQLIRNTLRRATREEQPERFRILANRLIDSHWSLTLNLILDTLLNALQSQDSGWHALESIRALCIPETVQSRSTYELRRLLRLALPPDLALNDRQAIVDAIRASCTDDFSRLNELADIQGWGVLSEGELQEVQEARAAGKLFPSRNPFDQSEFQDAVWVDSNPWPNAQADRWPYPDDRAQFRRLLERSSRDKSDAPVDFDGDLGPRLEALRIILARPDIGREEWFGSMLRFGHQALRDLKSWHRVQLKEPSNERVFNCEELRSLCDAHVPWWEILAQLAIVRLGGRVPSEHVSSDLSLLTWMSGDPLFESLQYLDEVLVVGPGEPFDALRRQLAEVMINIWDRWPSYTHATALAILRPFHWATVPGLSINIDRTLGREINPHVLEFCLGTMLRSSSSVAERLRVLIRRIAPIPGMSVIAAKVGQVIGNAVIRSRGDREDFTELQAVAALAEEFTVQFDPLMDFRLCFASGLLWGASSRLGSVESLTSRHAECWLPLVKWSLGEWLSINDDQDGDQIPIHPVMDVLEFRWPHETETDIYNDLTPYFVRIIEEAGLSTFCMFHFLVCQQLKGESRARRASPDHRDSPPFSRFPIPDDVLVRLSCASAQRIARWAAEGKKTNDWGFAGTLSGQETAELMRLAFGEAADRAFVRRGLAPCIDVIADAGLTELANDLRLFVRRG
jgi:hypothetical protein